MRKTRIAIFGCGFWSQFQIGGWLELEGVEIVALYNRTLSRAAERARQFGIAHYYDDPEAVFRDHEFDVADIITDVDTHANFVEMAAAHGKAVICQKPMAPSFETAQRMVEACRRAGVPYYVHENYRWQPQIRRLKAILDSGAIGKPFRARTAFNTAYPVFVNQPFLAELEEFALTDQGSHQFDVCRFLFGEVKTLYTKIQRVTPGIKGEDVVTSLMEMANGMVVTSEISFASRLGARGVPADAGSCRRLRGQRAARHRTGDPGDSQRGHVAGDRGSPAVPVAASRLHGGAAKHRLVQPEHSRRSSWERPRPKRQAPTTSRRCGWCSPLIARLVRAT